MKIEYLKEGSDDCPIIRMFGNETESIKLLMEYVARLSKGIIKNKIINEIEGFEGIDQCQIDMQLSKESRGLIEKKGNLFKCVLSQSGWQSVYELLGSFSGENNICFQWIDETSNISWLVSRHENGEW